MIRDREKDDYTTQLKDKKEAERQGRANYHVEVAIYENTLEEALDRMAKEIPDLKSFTVVKVEPCSGNRPAFLFISKGEGDTRVRKIVSLGWLEGEQEEIKRQTEEYIEGLSE